MVRRGIPLAPSQLHALRTRVSALDSRTNRTRADHGVRGGGGLEHSVLRRAEGPLDVARVDVAGGRRQAAVRLRKKIVDAHAGTASRATFAMNESSAAVNRWASTITGTMVLPCRYCGRLGNTPGIVLHVDHVLPHAAGGATREDNLRTACEECISAKGRRLWCRPGLERMGCGRLPARRPVDPREGGRPETDCPPRGGGQSGHWSAEGAPPSRRETGGSRIRVDISAS